MRTLRFVALLPIATACAAQNPKPSGTAPAMAASTRGDLLPDEQVQQVLNRLTFGPRPGDAEKVRGMGIDAYIDLQLHPERIDNTRTDSLMKRYPVFALATSDIVRDYNVVQQLQRQAKKMDAADSAMNRAEARRDILKDDPKLAETIRKTQQFMGEVQSAQLARAVTSDRQLEEVMAAFWENHFSVFAGKGQTRLFLTEYDRDVIRPRVLGKFRDLLGAVAKSPAMLFFLDNFQSAADSTQPTLAPARARARLQALRPNPKAPKRGLNENYARELMELHTLGVDGGYSQKDVQEVARALTGWTFDRPTGQFRFVPLIHDAGEKNILGKKFPAGHGQDEGERVLDLVASHPSTARYITTKLARHFVSDEPPKSLVDRCSDTFSKTEGDIRETVGCIVKSNEFFSRAAYRAKVKTPFELVASALRAVNAQADTTPRSAQIVARLGQPIFGRQTPDGWPDRADAWMNTGAILNRINFGLQLASGGVPGAQLRNLPEFATLRAQPREQQVDAVVKSMLGGQVSSVTRQVLMSGENPMLAKAQATTDPAPAMEPAMRGKAGAGLGRGQLPPAQTRPINLQGLPQVIGLALGAPEFQRR
jgi:uncharacterized protein (DUF1800 family)